MLKRTEQHKVVGVRQGRAVGVPVEVPDMRDQNGGPTLRSLFLSLAIFSHEVHVVFPMVNHYGEPALCDFDVTGMHLLDHQQCF